MKLLKEMGTQTGHFLCPKEPKFLKTLNIKSEEEIDRLKEINKILGLDIDPNSLQVVNGNKKFTSIGEEVNVELYITGGNSLLRITDSSMGNSQFNQIGLTFAPNPSKGKINIQNPQLLSISRVELHDITGKKMAEFQPEISNIIELNTEGIRPGIYFLQIENNGNRYTEKIIFE
jgi:hypothetical protein